MLNNAMNKFFALPSLSLRACLGAGFLMAFAPVAAADIYRCDTESGIPVYQNQAGKGCRKLELSPLTSMPAVKSVKTASTASAGSPASFPKVDTATQGARDSDRRRIIEEELRREESRLADLRKDFNGGEPERRGDERNFEKYQERVAKLRDDISRAEGSVNSLKRELALLR